MAKGNYFYAYLIPDATQGITETWAECERHVKGRTDARFRKFRTREEAEQWLDGGAEYADTPPAEPGIYFDSGTGRGQGMEISVTDENGTDLLSKILARHQINRFGKHWIFKDVSNNHGELLACSLALKIALQEGVKKVFGDSKLVIEYWSLGKIKKKEVDAETVTLAWEVKKLRKEFEAAGGILSRVPGDANPADLGFHQ